MVGLVRQAAGSGYETQYGSHLHELAMLAEKTISKIRGERIGLMSSIGNLSHGAENPDASLIKSLAEGCPLGEAMPDCPLHRLREEALKSRLDFMSSLTRPLQEYLCAHHAMCVKARKEGLISPSPVAGK